MARRLQMYGLAHCSTCQKAQAALTEAGWTVAFRDVREDPLTDAERQTLLQSFGPKLVNRASLTWRGMSEEERAAPAAEMIAAKPALIKRPAIVADDQHLLGWTANVKRALGIPA